MGLEVITQPQLFTKPITALGGYFGINEAWPLLTTYQSWTSTASVNASAFPIPGTWSMIDEPGSFIVTVGGVYQPSSEYTVSRTFRTLTFNSLVSAGVEIAAQQLATASPSAQSFNYIQSVSASIQSLSARTGTFDTLLVTNLTGLSTVVNIIDVRVSEVSGFRSTGDVQIDGNVTISRNIYLSGDLYLGTGDQIITPAINATNATITNTTVTNLTGTALSALNAITTNLSALNFVLTDNGSLLGQTSATSINIGSLSARQLSLIHDPANDGVDPVLDIGETLTGSFSGFRIRYEEASNRLICSSRTGTAILTSIIVNTITGQVGVSAIPNEALTVAGNISATGGLYLGSGSTTLAPIRMLSGTNLTTPAAGAIEYDGTAFYATPNISLGRATIPTIVYTSGAGTVGTVNNTAYALFPSTNDTITLSAGTYLVTLGIRINNTGTVAAALQFNIKGSGTAVGSMTWRGTGSIVDPGAANLYANSATALGTAMTITATSGAVAKNFNAAGQGILRITTGGTIVPSYQFGAASDLLGTTSLFADNYLVLQSLDTQTAALAGPSGAGWV